MDDAAFREQFKPVHVPSSFEGAETLQDKVIYALAELNEGTADEVARKLKEFAPSTPDEETKANAHHVLTDLYKKGLIAANENHTVLVYNLHKITKANKGNVNTNLLAPGLD